MTAHIPEVYYVITDHGRRGRETIIDWEACSKRDVIEALVTGQYDRPLEVHCIDREGRRWADVSEDIAREICSRVVDGDPMPVGGVFDFCEQHLGCRAMADLAREMEAA